MGMKKEEIEENKKALREKYASVGYSGYSHLLKILLSLGLFVVSSLYFVRSPAMVELMIIPVGFIAANFLEYILHRGPMHHKIKYFGPVYDHVTVHHMYFPIEDFTAHGPLDFKYLILPPLIFMGLVLFIAGASICLYMIGFSLNASLLFGATMFTYYLSYEILHFSYHQDKKSWVGEKTTIDQHSS
jgi:hypothetical protein